MGCGVLSLKVQIDTEYLPQDKESQYKVENVGRSLRSLIPQGREHHDFSASLATKFKSVSTYLPYTMLVLSPMLSFHNVNCITPELS